MLGHEAEALKAKDLLNKGGLKYGDVIAFERAPIARYSLYNVSSSPNDNLIPHSIAMQHIAIYIGKAEELHRRLIEVSLSRNDYVNDSLRSLQRIAKHNDNAEQSQREKFEKGVEERLRTAIVKARQKHPDENVHLNVVEFGGEINAATTWAICLGCICSALPCCKCCNFGEVPKVCTVVN